MNQTSQSNRRIVLASRPHGAPIPDNFRLEEQALPALVDGQVLLRTVYLSLDPYMRGRMSDGPSYAEPHDAIMARRDQIKTKKIWDRDDPYFAATVARAKEDGITLETDNKIIRDGNKVRVYMTSIAPSFGMSEFTVNQGVY